MMLEDSQDNTSVPQMLRISNPEGKSKGVKRDFYEKMNLMKMHVLKIDLNKCQKVWD